MPEMEMRRISIAALIVALLAAGVSGFALWRTYDTDTAERSGNGAQLVGGTTSTTVRLVTIPSQAGKGGMQAAADLKKAGLEVKVSRKASVTVPVNRVVGQSPIEGPRVPAGTIVELFLSSGPP
jgi:hypothetical protein